MDYTADIAQCITYTSTGEPAKAYKLTKDGCEEITRKEWAIMEIKEQPYFYGLSVRVKI